MSSIQILKAGAKTLALSGLGTAALVGAHHLGRKQYNPNARLLDYAHGMMHKMGTLQAKGLSNSESDVSVSTQQVAQTVQIKETVDNILLNNNAPCWVSGVADLNTNAFAVVGIDETQQLVWQTTMPERVHDILIQPTHSSEPLKLDKVQHVAVMGRRPSEWFWILDAQNGTLLHSIHAEEGRHFYGHACYSLAGDLLYVTENNTEDFSGIIGVYDVAQDYKKITEFASHGIGPHEIVMHPDGETLVIANGGIKTERASREELNLDSMQPSLVYLNRHTGELLEQIFPEHNQMSVRHLAMHDSGRVAIGIQFQGPRHLSVPMVLTHSRGEANFTPLQIPKHDTKGWHRFHHYIASVAIDSTHNLLCATSPLSGCASVFDLDTGLLIDDTMLADCAGVTTGISKEERETNQKSPQFLVSDGQGHLTSIRIERQTDEQGNKVPVLMSADKVHQPYAFDNHLTTLTIANS